MLDHRALDFLVLCLYHVFDAQGQETDLVMIDGLEVEGDPPPRLDGGAVGQVKPNVIERWIF